MAAENKGQRLSREARREHFLDVAAKLMLERGLEAVTMESIAAAAGVSKGLGYVYFDNRGDVLVALMHREMAIYAERAMKGIADAPDLEAMVRAGTAAWFDLVAERGNLLGALLSAPHLTGPLAEAQRALSRQAAEFYADLALTQMDLDRNEAIAACALLLDGLSGTLTRWLQGQVSREEVEPVFVRVALAGLLALVPAAPTEPAP